MLTETVKTLDTTLPGVENTSHDLPAASEARAGRRAPGEPLPAGVRGEICVRGPQVMADYWRDPQATAAVIDGEGWFHTGDVGLADDDGYVWVIDRVKDIVISGGENVYPAEVEDALYGHPAVAEVAVIGTPHERWGEAVTAVVVLQPCTTLTLEELRAFARDKLAGFKIPLRLAFVDTLPRTQSGKVMKYQLREQLRLPGPGAMGAAPS